MVTWQDLVNGGFEIFAGLFVLDHCRKLYKDKIVRGVSFIAVVFFTSWGFWNMYYYRHLEQIISFFGGLGVVSANCLWVGMMLYYMRKEKQNAISR
jgi:hypothetical protein